MKTNEVEDDTTEVQNPAKDDTKTNGIKGK